MLSFVNTFIALLAFFVIVSHSRHIRGYDYEDHEYDSNEDHDDFDHDHSEDKLERRAIPTNPPAAQDFAPDPNNCACAVTTFVPQCGSDGRTYADACKFKCAQGRNRNLKLARSGQCPATNG